MLRRRLLLACAAAVLATAGCALLPQPAPAADGAVRNALVPTGTLRVAVYRGSPTSLVTAADGKPAGVAHDLGQAMGRALGVPVRVVEFQRVAQVVEALQAGEADVTFTNASEARARVVDFTEPLLRLELGVLVPAGSTATDLAGLDRAGVRLGVSLGSSSQAALPRVVRQAGIVPLPSLDEAARQLRAGGLDGFATNKAILFELSGQVPGSRVLDGRWGHEQLAIAVPQGRRAGAAWLHDFGRQQRSSGALQAMAARAGLRGLAAD